MLITFDLFTGNPFNYPESRETIPFDQSILEKEENIWYSVILRREELDIYVYLDRKLVPIVKSKDSFCIVLGINITNCESSG